MPARGMYYSPPAQQRCPHLSSVIQVFSGAAPGDGVTSMGFPAAVFRLLPSSCSVNDWTAGY